MPADPFSLPGRFFRGNLHSHSTRSDGALAPAEVCRRYADEGYDFLALTDHFLGRFGYPLVDTRPFWRPGFTTLAGAELHAGATALGELWHILAVGLPEGFAPPHAPGFRPEPGQESGPALAARAAAAGAFVAIAHPQWSGLTLADAASLDAAHAVEVYNHGCANCVDRGDGLHVADLLAAGGRRLSFCATDDAHFTEPDHFGAWVMVKAEANAPEALLAALRAGNHYSTQGPEFRGLAVVPGAVEVASSAVRSVIVQGRGSRAAAVHGLSMTRARVPLAKFEGSDWLRVTLIDAAGRRAWSNPIWREGAGGWG
ncbi:MAG: phosphotransferase [Rhodobacteraceae bacterium]|nr:phosphotransferase [Paracoccaceae bacterium]